MSELANVIVNGLASGAIYASLALALVVTFRSTGVINFAQGEMAMFSTFIAWELIHAGLPVWLAVIGSLVFAFAAGAAVERTVIRPVQQAPHLTIVIVTLGVFLIFNNLAGWIWSYVTKSFPPAFTENVWHVDSVSVSAQSAGTVGVLVVEAAALYAFFKYTRLGLAMRAVATNVESSRLMGIRIGRVLMLGWGIGAMLGAVAGVLIAPTIFLQPNMMFNVLIYAFAAVTLGGFDSPVGAVVGGLTVGLVSNLTAAYVSFIGTDLKLVVPLGLILAVLLVRPSGLFGTRQTVRV